MARKHFRGGYHIDVSLDGSSLQDAIGEIGLFREDLLAKIDEFTRLLAQEGVKIARMKLIDSIHHPELSTGKLAESITLRRGDVIENGSQWIVYTDNEYAQFVEFGTGPVAKASNGHPSGSGAYRSTGWSFNAPPNWQGAWSNKKANRAWTMGQAPKAFMWNTAEYLKQTATIKKIAKEVFG